MKKRTILTAVIILLLLPGTKTLKTLASEDYPRYPYTTLDRPSNVKCSVNKRKVTLTWKKSKGAAEYEIHRKTGSGGKYKWIGNTHVNVFLDKVPSLRKSRTYYYKIVAINSHCESKYSKVKKVRIIR